MTRAELSHLLRAAARIADVNEIVVIGSQSILGTYDEDELPSTVTVSREADLTFWDDPNDELSDRVDGAIGELSPFDQMNGYYAQGVSLTTAVVPEGWRERLVPFACQSSEPAVGMCLEKHDLALSKLAAHRQKDYLFVEALIEAQLLDSSILTARIDSMDVPSASATRMRRWIAASVNRTRRDGS